MANYSGAEFIAALAKGVFGLALAYVVGFSLFQSLFFFLLTLAFFVFVPFQHEKTEEGMNALFFGVLMFFILFLGASNNPAFGLGFDVGGTFETAGAWKYLVAMLFAASLILSIPTPLDRVFELGAIRPIAIGMLVLTILVSLFLLQPWTWNTTAIVFIGFWSISLLGGAAGDLGSRHVLGVLFLIMAIFIFTTQAGTQVVGTLAFGQYFPTVYQGATELFKPLSDVFGQLSTTFGQGVRLLTSPQEFARDIINGTYQTDPTTGLAGAFGVEIEEFRTTPIFTEQAYAVTMRVRNRGAFNAENVSVILGVGEKPPQAGAISWTPVTLEELGLKEKEQSRNLGSLPKLDVRQEFFQADKLACTAVVKYSLQEKFIPLKATVEYDYKIDSELTVDFISDSEWDRRIQEEGFIPQRKKPATLKNAPVQLNLDTLEQPIRGSTPFFLGFQLVPAQKDGKILESDVVVTLPPELFGALKSCSPTPKEQPTPYIIWHTPAQGQADERGGSMVAYCQFNPLNITEPTKSFLVQALSDYRFSSTKESTPAKVEFGGVACCKEAEDCPNCKGVSEADCPWTCTANVCEAKQTSTSPGVPPSEGVLPGPGGTPGG